MFEQHEHRKALFWEQHDDGIHCRLCPHACVLSEGQSGICHVRTVRDGELTTLVYGYPSALHVDPIEKKPLFHFLPGSKAFSIGTQGCNLSCKFCQNWHLSTQIGHTFTYVSPEEIIVRAIESQCKSIAFTYNEPIIFAEYAIDIQALAREAGLPCIMVTNGFINPEARASVFKNIDAVNIDLKAFTDETYVKFTGGRLAPVLDTITWCVDNGIHTELTTLIIPGVNDDREMMEKECQWIIKHCGDTTALHINAFHPDHKMKDYPRTSRSALMKCVETAQNCGLKYIYVGNYPGFDNNTYCPECGDIVVKRNMYEVESVVAHQHKAPIIWSVQ
jgi:pyruvate formate lyase activating enzyme